jgi:hypothetical protein
MYGIRMTPARAAALRATFAAIRAGRPFLPPRFRYLAPYDEWRRTMRGEDVGPGVAGHRRSLGIRLGA